MLTRSLPLKRLLRLLKVLTSLSETVRVQLGIGSFKKIRKMRMPESALGRSNRRALSLGRIMTAFPDEDAVHKSVRWPLQAPKIRLPV